MVNWGGAVPIVVAIIGISGVVLPVFSSVFVNQFYNKPNINIDIGTKPEKGKQIINITNSGTISATNLSLIITANNHIINDVTNLLSTTDVFLVNPGPPSLLEINRLKPINGLLLELHVKKLVNGGGSIIELATGTKSATTFKDYVVYATYDQGSRKMSIEKSPLQNSTNAVFSFVLLYGVVAELIVLFFVLYIARIYGRRRFLQRIKDEIMNAFLILRHDPENMTTNILESWPRQQWRPRPRWWQWRQLQRWKQQRRLQRIDHTWSEGGGSILFWKMDSLRIINELNDYIRVDDFYSKLNERNSYITKNKVIEGPRLEELNKQCLELATMALEKIDWNKYRSKYW